MRRELDSEYDWVMVREALILDVLQFVYGMDPVAFVVEVDSIKP